MVADTENHRVQLFTNFGVFKNKFGSKGTAEGQFDEPTGVCELPNGDIAVADKNNKRICVFDDRCKFKYTFETKCKPYSIACDRKFNIVIGTTNRTVEVYRRTGPLVYTFSLGGKKSLPGGGFHIDVNNKEEVLVSDPMQNLVKFYTYSGQLLYKFMPLSNSEGLSVLTGGVCFTPTDQVVVADSLNHTVNLYTERGILLQQLLCPTDNVGTVQTCTLGPEGHLIITEYSIMGEHCMKIFRYRPCACHESRPGSSKRRTPTQMT